MTSLLISPEIIEKSAYLTVGWATLNAFSMIVPLPMKCSSKTEEYDLRNRMVSITHGIMSVSLAAY